ncbi:hypothetical protein AVEN_176262-1 [Araneus ventricosus]|uniref:Uncharacterized protein n=1 Tax=Araneus ventricosus TaxID=182803 RepID=A0A4Y2U413_ARAVE|nr:hypothetical protein AVEN_176262-1 [Araneus ventricosus]
MFGVRFLSSRLRTSVLDANLEQCLLYLLVFSGCDHRFLVMVGPLRTDFHRIFHRTWDLGFSDRMTPVQASALIEMTDRVCVCCEGWWAWSKLSELSD